MRIMRSVEAPETAPLISGTSNYAGNSRPVAGAVKVHDSHSD